MCFFSWLGVLVFSSRKLWPLTVKAYFHGYGWILRRARPPVTRGPESTCSFWIGAWSERVWRWPGVHFEVYLVQCPMSACPTWAWLLATVGVCPAPGHPSRQGPVDFGSAFWGTRWDPHSAAHLASPPPCRTRPCSRTAASGSSAAAEWIHLLACVQGLRQGRSSGCRCGRRSGARRPDGPVLGTQDKSFRAPVVPNLRWRWDWGGCQEGPVIPSEEVLGAHRDYIIC